MTVPNEVPLVDYVGNGTTTEFNVPFQYETPSTLFISVNGVNPSTSDYLFNPDTGNFVFYTAPADGVEIRIARDTPEGRDTDYDDNYNTFRPRTLNKDFDRLWRAIQEHLITINLNKDGLAQEILERIQADEDMLDYIMNQDNAIKQDYIQRDSVINAASIERDNRIEQESKNRDSGLKNYIDNLVALITGDPSFNGITTDFVTEDGETQRQKNNKVKRGIGNTYDSSLSYNINDRVLLDDGTEVTSTIASNTNDPNVDMTGWLIATQILQYVSDISTAKASSGSLIFVSQYSASYSFGGGFFVIKSGVATEDGGHIFKINDSYYAERICEEVNLYHYGIIPSRYQDSATYIDVTAKVKAAITRSISTGMPLVSPFQKDYQQMYITEGLDITGIRTMRGVFFFIHPDVADGFTPIFPQFYKDPVGYALINTNCTWGSNGKIYGTSAGQQYIESIVTRVLTSRNTPLNGQLHIAYNSDIQAESYHYKGYGLNFSDCFDGRLRPCVTKYCGYADTVNNLAKYAFYCGSYMAYDSTSRIDEFNSMTIDGVMCHDAYDYAFYVWGSKNRLVRMHEEATVLTTGSPVGTPSSDGSMHGRSITKGYQNSVFGGFGSSAGNIDIAPLSTNGYEHVVGLTLNLGCHVDLVYTSQSVSLANYGTSTGTINNVACVNLYADNNTNSQVDIGNARVSGIFTTLGGTHIQSGNITGVATLTSGTHSFGAVTLAGNVVAAPESLVTCYGRTSFTGASVTLSCPVVSIDSANFGSSTTLTTNSTNVAGNISISKTRLRNYTNSSTLIADIVSCNGGGSYGAWSGSMRITGCWNINISLLTESIFFQSIGCKINILNIGTVATGQWLIDDISTITTITGWKLPTTGSNYLYTRNPVTGVKYKYSGGWKTISESLT